MLPLSSSLAKYAPLALSFLTCTMPAIAQPPTLVAPADAPAPTLSLQRSEASFTLATTGNPFDFTENDVRVTVVGPKGKRWALPAFFDGGTTWRVRAAFDTPGAYRLTQVTRNGAAASVASLTPKVWNITRAQAKFAQRLVGRDPGNVTRFAHADGTAYYPVGQNVAWNTGTPIPTIFDHMGAAGETWARVWMNHWDNKNLDWPTPAGGRGHLDLAVARKWDDIVQAAERNGIYFQMTLQHHGQYSTRVNPNWGENPWNKALGGFLATPQDFFTDPQALALTRAKYRYIVARWGYSPNVLAWELFNEVQFTDTAEAKKYDDIARWHRDMAAFVREQDSFKHLVTTSSDVTIPGLYDAMDYIQPHSYPPDVLAATQALHPTEWKKPLFYGEIGPGRPSKTPADEISVIHTLLWGSLMSEASGAAQYWGWEGNNDPKVYPTYTAATAFVRQTGIGTVADLHAIMPTVQTRTSGSAQWGPGGGWGKGKQTVFSIQPSGSVDGTADMPAYLQGTTHADLFTAAEFPVTLTALATFTVTFDQVAKGGAHPALLVDGKTVADRELASTTDNQRGTITLTASLPTGTHTLRLQNTGADWARIADFTLAPFGPSLAVVGKASNNKAALWLYRRAGRETPETATLTLPTILDAGRYRIQWWDTETGKPMRETTVSLKDKMPLILTTPPISHDIAVWIAKLK